MWCSAPPSLNSFPSRTFPLSMRARWFRSEPEGGCFSSPSIDTLGGFTPTFLGAALQSGSAFRSLSNGRPLHCSRCPFCNSWSAVWGAQRELWRRANGHLQAETSAIKSGYLSFNSPYECGVGGMRKSRPLIGCRQACAPAIRRASPLAQWQGFALSRVTPHSAD